MDFLLENLVARDFTNLDKTHALEVLEARNAVREFMLTNRIIYEAEYFRFIESLKNDKKNAYFAVYEVSNASLQSGDFKNFIAKEPLPKSLPQREEPSFSFPSLASGDSLNSPSLAEGVRGWVESKESSLRGSGEAQAKQSKKDLNANSLQTATFLGVICLNNIDLANKNAYFGIYSNIKNNTNNGTKMLKMLTFIAFSELNLRILYAKVLSTNVRAINFYKKHSFIPCGKLIEAIKRKNVFVDLEIWALKCDIYPNPIIRHK